MRSEIDSIEPTLDAVMAEAKRMAAKRMGADTTPDVVPVSDAELAKAVQVFVQAGFLPNDDLTYKRLARWYALYRRGDHKHKGLFLYGDTGRGKTFFMRRVLKPHISLDGFYAAKAIQLDADESGPNGWLDICDRHARSDYPHDGDIIIDDILSENISKHYGKTHDVIAEMLDALYSWSQRGKFVVLLTANRYEISKGVFEDNPIKAISARYGDRIASRIREMCEVIVMAGRDMRL